MTDAHNAAIAAHVWAEGHMTDIIDHPEDMDIDDELGTPPDTSPDEPVPDVATDTVEE